MVLAAAVVAAWPVAEPHASALSCVAPRGVYQLELVSLEVIAGDADLAVEEASLEPSPVFDASFLEMRADEFIYFERVTP